MRALVVSADSAIGGALCEELGCAGTTRRLPSQGRIRFDLQSPERLPIADVTYFCGAINGFKACAEAPELAHLVNVEGTVKAAQSQVERGGRVILLSSCAAETHPETVYGSLKLEAEGEFLRLGNMASIFRFGPVMFPGRTCYPNKDYQPIELEKLVGVLTAPFQAGLHRILNRTEIVWKDTEIHPMTYAGKGCGVSG